MSDEKILTKEIDLRKHLTDEDYMNLHQFSLIEDEMAEILVQYEGRVINLSGLTTLSDATAKSLGRYNGGELFLDGLTQLSDSAAKSLSQYEGKLSLSGLTVLLDTPGHLELLSTLTSSRYDDILNFSLLSTLPEGAAFYLGAYTGALFLDGLTSLSDSAAEFLSAGRGDLYLNGLTTISDAAAKSLSERYGGNLGLAGLATISEAAAEALSQYRGTLWLDGLANISDSVAESLGKHLGDLGLEGLTNLSDYAAECLSKVEGELDLNGLTHLSDAAAKSLLYSPLHSKELCPECDASQSEKVASCCVFCGFSGPRQVRVSGYPILLESLKSLSDTAAVLLCQSKRDLSLNFNILPESAADILRKHPSFKADDDYDDDTSDEG